jgi:HEAT repeat protein
MVTPESVEVMLKSEDFGQRLSAVNQMRQLDPAIAFHLLQVASEDRNTRVRYAAVSQLASVGHQDDAVTLELLRDRLLHDPEIDVQAAAADALGALHYTTAFEDLQQLYHSTNEWMLKFSIIAALGELGDLRAFDLLKDALDSDNDLVKTAAVGSLGELGDRRALPLIMPYATSPDWQLRYRVVQALGRFDQPEAQSALESLASDEVGPVAEEAKNQLQQFQQ